MFATDLEEIHDKLKKEIAEQKTRLEIAIANGKPYDDQSPIVKKMKQLEEELKLVLVEMYYL